MIIYSGPVSEETEEKYNESHMYHLKFLVGTFKKSKNIIFNILYSTKYIQNIFLSTYSQYKIINEIILLFSVQH